VDREAIRELGASLGHLLDIHRIQPRSPSCGPKKCGPACS
jgi:hypothetical protein